MLMLKSSTTRVVLGNNPLELTKPIMEEHIVKGHCGPPTFAARIVFHNQTVNVQSK
jgi:hypothetical protein